MKVLKILEDAEVMLADIEFHLGKKIQHEPTLCVIQRKDYYSSEHPKYASYSDERRERN